MTVEQNSFITNQEKLLSDIMNGILPKTASTDILVGYFYFSGYKLLAENFWLRIWQINKFAFW